jgi:hypothetical protein
MQQISNLLKAHNVKFENTAFSLHEAKCVTFLRGKNNFQNWHFKLFLLLLRTLGSFTRKMFEQKKTYSKPENFVLKEKSKV